MAAKKIVPTMEELFDTLPEEPEGFRDYCISLATPVPIFYKGKKHSEIIPGLDEDYAVCRCGRCGKEYIIQGKAKRGIKTSCAKCNTDGVYEWNRCSRKKQEYFTVVLIQCRTDLNLVIRYFHCYNEYWNGHPQRFEVTEEKRVFLNLGDYYKFTYRSYYKRWEKNGSGTRTYSDTLYPGSEEEIAKSNFKYFKQSEYGGIESELEAYSKNPALEMFEKAGLKRLRQEVMLNGGSNKHINRRGKNMKEQLRLKDKSKINFLIKHNGGVMMLELLQEEEKKGIKYTDGQRQFLESAYSQWNGRKVIAHLTRYMSLQKLINRVDKYVAMKETIYDNRMTVMSRWNDYLEMREELGYDMTNEVFIYPKSLKEKHDEMVNEKARRRNELFEKNAEKTYKGIAEKFQKAMEKYGWESEGLTIRPAMNATEIIREGRELHHCVGRDTYLARHSMGESFILFLRKISEREKPYYTIEIRDKKIVQWYGAHDKKPDIEVVGPWLNNFILHIKGDQVVYG